jgi:hypothetical protein
MLMHDLYRCQLIEFGVKVLGLEGETPFQHTGFVFRAPRDGRRCVQFIYVEGASYCDQRIPAYL